MNIKIKEVGSDDIFFEYYLPINLLPLFYYKGYEKFKLFIIALIHWNEESQKFEIDENIYTTINNLLTKCKELKLKFDILDELEPEDEKVIMPNPMPLKKTMSIGKSLISKFEKKNTKGNFGAHNLAKSLNFGGNSNLLFAGTNVDIIQKKALEKKTFKLSPKEEKDYSYLNFNTFNFFWKTPTKTFSVCIETPLITFGIQSYNIMIRQYIDYELLFYLFTKKFDSWDFYVIKYISSYKLFRIILSQIASFNPRKNLNLFLENPKFKNYDYTDDRIINILTMNDDFKKSKKVGIKKDTEFDKIEEDLKEHNDSIDEKTHEHKKENKGIEDTKNKINIIQTEETVKQVLTNDSNPDIANDKKNIKNQNNNKINVIIEQKCFKAIVTLSDFEKNKANEYSINFNYYQFNKFKTIEKYMNKNHL